MLRTYWRKQSVLALAFFSLCYFSVQAQEFELEKLPEPINTALYDEIGCIPDTGENKIFFTRIGYPGFNKTLIQDGVDLSKRMSEAALNQYLCTIFSRIEGAWIKDAVSSAYNQDIFIADLTSMQVEHPPYPVNSALPNSAIGLSKDQKSLYLINRFYRSGSMYEGISRMKWNADSPGFPEPLFVKDFDLFKGDLNAHMSPDGEVVLFAYDKNSEGNKDLYISYYTGSGDNYTRMKSLGDEINTGFNESTPFLSSDKRWLYFVSDRPGSIGETDIYVSQRLDYTYLKWSRPEALGQEINSVFHESHPYIDASSGHLYFCSNRDGSMDIYRYHQKEIIRTYDLMIEGKVIDRSNGELISAEVYYGPQSLNDYLEYYHTYTGAFNVHITISEPFKFKCEKNGYKSEDFIFNPNTIRQNDEGRFSLTLYMDPVDSVSEEESVPLDTAPKPDALARPDTTMKVDTISMSDVILTNDTVIKSDIQLIEDIIEEKHISLHDIHFVKSQATLLDSSIPHLQTLLRIMKENPSLRIEISGHTDNIGPLGLLLELSIKRAEKIKRFLVSSGVHTSRIKTRGYGHTRPLNKNRNEEERQLNRRVEIRVITN